MMRYTQSRAARSAPIVPATLAALLIAASLGSSANAQSFDCRNARSADEKAICQESRLGDLDKQLAGVYDRVGGKLSKQDREAFEKNETAFVNARHRCGEHRGCIEQSYRNRIQELLSALPEDAAGRPDRPDNAKPSDRQKASRDSGKLEDAQPVPDDAKRDTGEAAVKPPEKSSGLKEPAQKEPAQNESAGTAVVVPNPPSRHEAEAALTGQPASEKPSRHKRRTESAAIAPAPAATPAPQAREEPPTASAPPATERHPRKSAAAPALERHQVAEGSTVAAEPANPPEKRRSRGKHVASGTSAPSPAPVDQANPASKPEIKWVNPAPSQ